MICPKCGATINDDVRFCTNCGVLLSGSQNHTTVSHIESDSSGNESASFDNNNVEINYPGYENASSDNYRGQNYANSQQSQQSQQPRNGAHYPERESHTEMPGKKPKKSKALLITLILIAVILCIAIVAFVVWKFVISEPGSKKVDSVYNSEAVEVIDDETETEVIIEDDTPEIELPPEEEEEEPDKNAIVVEAVNSLISSKMLSADVGVAIIDNQTNEKFLCNGYDNAYVSWGFYLPVYFALELKYPDMYDSYKLDIMGTDIGKCNSAGNFAMDCFGGPLGMTEYIREETGFTQTSFGRKYGDVNSNAENYTSPIEAAAFLSSLSSAGRDHMLCHSASQFGITVPSDSTMYGQFGTENRGVKNNLNVFAVVKGNTSDYSIAIMTKNKASASGIVDEILSLVHTKMEG